MEKKLIFIFMFITLGSFSMYAQNHKDAKKGQIILVSGVQGSGKSTVCKLLQETLTDIYIYLPIDGYVELMPKRLVDLNPKTTNTESDGITFVKDISGEHPICNVQVGAKVMPFIETLPEVIKLFCDKGHNIILEGAFYGDWLNWIVNKLDGYKAIFVGLTCPLDVAEEREKLRGGFLGAARAIFAAFSENKIYDIEIDTAKLKPNEAVKKIKEYVESNPIPKAFEKIKKN